MVKLYADEQCPYPVVQRLIAKGFDVLTVQEAKIERTLADRTSIAGELIRVNRPSLKNP